MVEAAGRKQKSLNAFLVQGFWRFFSWFIGGRMRSSYSSSDEGGLGLGFTLLLDQGDREMAKSSRLILPLFAGA